MWRWLALSISFWASSAFATPPVYVSLKAPFQKFVQEAAGRDFETQLQLWQTDVESVIPDVYAHLLSEGGKPMGQYRRERAEKWFPFLLANSAAILAQFDTFETSGWPAAQRLSDNFPAVDFSDVRVIAMRRRARIHACAA